MTDVTWLPGRNPYTTMIGRHRLRFYDPPHSDPDYPWVDFADAIQLLEFPDAFQTKILERWQQAWPALVHALPSGRLIVSNICASGMYQFYIMQEWPPAEAARSAYDQTAANLLARMTAHLSRSELHALCQRASLRYIPVVPGEMHVN